MEKNLMKIVLNFNGKEVSNYTFDKIEYDLGMPTIIYLYRKNIIVGTLQNDFFKHSLKYAFTYSELSTKFYYLELNK